MLALLLLSMLAAQDSKPEKKLDLENTRLLLYDSVRNMTFKIQNDGKVELTVQEEDKAAGKKVSRTYASASAAEFRAQYPDLVKKYELGRHLGGAEERRTLSQDEFDEWWKKLKKGVPDLGPIPGLERGMDEEFQKFFDEQLGRLRRPFRVPKDPAPDEAPRQAPLPGGREFGLRVGEVGETLRDQLSLKDSEGVIVTEVKAGSLAEKAGMKEHDILLALDGKAVTDRWQFRSDILVALGKPEFELQILRSGKREAVKVKTAAKKDE
jgi:hypothetical protein